MIQQIINDAKAMEAEAIRAEEDAQKAYEDFVKDTNGSVEEKNRDIVHKSEVKAKAEADLVQAKDDHEAVLSSSSSWVTTRRSCMDPAISLSRTLRSVSRHVMKRS